MKVDNYKVQMQVIGREGGELVILSKQVASRQRSV